MKKILLLSASVLGLISCSSSVNENAIQGANPYDIYKPLEDLGFSNEKIHSLEYGISYQLKKKENGADYICDIFSMKVNTIESLRATIMQEPAYGKIKDYSFLSFIGSVPYDIGNQSAAAEWVKRNVNKASDTIIGDAKFSILKPTDYTRILYIEKHKE